MGEVAEQWTQTWLEAVCAQHGHLWSAIDGWDDYGYMPPSNFRCCRRCGECGWLMPVLADV